jgi:hypothetical protein
MNRDGTQKAIRQRYRALAASLNERQRRLWAAAEAKALGYGGISCVAQATGISRRAIHTGLRELDGKQTWPKDRIRRSGGGRKRLTDKQPGLVDALDRLVEPTARGDPESPLRWSCKGVRRLAEELRKQDYQVGRQKISELLHSLGYSLQACCKTHEGGRHPDRDQQFGHIAQRTSSFLKAGQPAISVDTKKKELVGNYKNGGQEWQPKGQPPEVKVHDFIDKKLGRAIPYGVYDLAANMGWVGVGTDHDTAAFAVATIRAWWHHMGQSCYSQAQRLLITADGGGSNSSRSRAWKVQLQELADELSLTIWVCHFPPGTSKWNKIEHRLFSQIAINWRGQPLTSHEVVVQLIAATTTTSGLKVRAKLDPQHYPTGIKVDAKQWSQVRLRRDKFHGDWNYVIKPRTRRKKL